VVIGTVWSDESILEALTRGGAVGAFLGLAVVMARGPLTPPRVTGVLFCLAVASHTLTQQPGGLARMLGVAWPAIWAFSAMTGGFFWAFATELFGDRPRLQPARLAPALLLLAIAIIAATNAGWAKGLWLLHNLLAAALMTHVLIVVWSGWRNDLVESRRRLRGPILAVGAVYAVSVIAVQISEILWRPATALSPLAAIMLLGLGLAGVAVFLQAHPDLFAPMRDGQATAESPTPELSAEDTRIARQLERLMREERVYREEGLSIAGLALRLRIPEHRLRRLINTQLGHRNFNAFLNHWRLDDATQALADPTQRQVPISTIALDAGFQSLGPFNRAFKAATGLTPSEFRVQCGGGTTA